MVVLVVIHVVVVVVVIVVVAVGVDGDVDVVFVVAPLVHAGRCVAAAPALELPRVQPARVGRKTHRSKEKRCFCHHANPVRPARAEFWCEEHPQRKRERDGSGSGCIRWSTIERQHESCGSVECETKFDLGLEIRLEPEEFEARREGVVELDSNATFIGGVVINAAERCGDQEIQKMAAMGCEHQTTCMNFVKEQIKTDRFFLFELPWNAGSWQMPEFVEVARMDSVQDC